MKRLIAVAVGLAVLAAPNVASAAHSWNGLHWARSSNPFPVTVEDRTTSLYTAHVNQAVADWNASSVLDVSLGSGSRKIVVEEGFYGQGGWIGSNTVSFDPATMHILSSRAKLNNSYLVDHPSYATDIRRDYTTCHEIGHGFGLGHQDVIHSNQNLGSCLDYTNDADGPPPNLQPNAHDYEMLETIYGAHLDSGRKKGGPKAAAQLRHLIEEHGAKKIKSGPLKGMYEVTFYNPTF